MTDPPVKKSWSAKMLGWLAKMFGQVVLTILGVVIAIALAPFTPFFDQALSRWHYVEPTCEDPRGLELLDVATMEAEGTATVEASSELNEESRRKMNAFDGRPGSGWVPETESSRADSAETPTDWIELTFTSPQPIALLCVVNGNASDWVSYMRADRVRTVEVSLGDGEPHRISLRTLPEYEMQNRQDLGVRPPATLWRENPPYNRVSLTLVDRYLGSQVDDPNTGDTVDAPTKEVMLAELELWVEPEQ
ncbi:hypothetical protein E2F48_11540 [Arthrobacter crusticola]|uniref:Discoidin domain-containing protein n=1 Tax=Arthrobacter crusticola TaxID=2547960 RepID=A0A4R5TXK0_9MICC|nr:hypothetical protein [Arthrobacter crusticola]TDK25848.1 hypothetical protein E2F48_11540 [Arthrobacter crusticola]